MTYYTDEISVAGGKPVECYKFSQTSPIATTTWRFTSDGADVVLPDGTFTPESISRGSMVFRAEDHSGSVNIHLPLTHAIPQLFATIPPQWPLSITIYRAHRGDLANAVTIFVGHVATVTFGNEEATIACVPISARLSLSIPTISVQSQCVWNLYGTGCGAAIASFESLGTVSAISGVLITASVFGTKPNGWFNNGYIRETATGVRRFIVDHVGTAVTVSQPFLPQLLVTAAFTAYAGCDRSEAVCEAKFNNLANHLGFPRIPQRNPHDDRNGGRVWRSVQRRQMTER